MIRLDLDRPEGVRWVPDEHAGDGVLVVAGSSGRIDADRAKLFAREGCLAESIRWFGGPDQNAGPWEIPLETFLQRIDDLKRECQRVYMVGTSFGAEAALLCGAYSDNVDGVIGFAPSDVVWAGYDGTRETTHWTIAGRPSPYVSLDWEHYVAETPARYRRLYAQSRLTFAKQVPAATIPVDRVQDMILVAGGDDQVWPSVAHAEHIRTARDAAGLLTVMITSPDAGHRTILPGAPEIDAGVAMMRGGTTSADRTLGIEAWKAITELLHAHR